MKIRTQGWNTLLFVIMIALIVVLSGCASPQVVEKIVYVDSDGQHPLYEEGDTVSNSYITFDSEADVLEFLSDTQSSTNPHARSFGGTMMMDAVAESAISSEAKVASPQYSETNVQVEGIDEADYIKTDGKYIYMIVQGVVHIVPAGVNDPSIISSITLPIENEQYYGNAFNQNQELYIYDDMLVVITQSYDEGIGFSQYSIEPYTTREPKTVILTYDLGQIEDPVLLETYSISGGYYTSRLKEGIVYVVAQENPFYNVHPRLPVIMEGDVATTPRIGTFVMPEQNYQYNTIVSIDLDKQSIVDSESLLMGWSSTLMMSDDNIFIAYQSYNSWRWFGNYEMNQRDRFVQAVVPVLEGSLKRDIDAILSQDYSLSEEWLAIETVLKEFYLDVENNPAAKDQYGDMIENIAESLAEYDMQRDLEQSKTYVHKIAIDDGQLDYVAKGEMNGRLLNQFSLDEHNGYLRAATTTSIWSRERIQYSTVYVFDAAMQEVGRVDNIAPDESIFSARFMGDTLYLVTFEQIDPFFVIDLSNPANPKILGELKLPGFSNYLHPISEDLILGIGKEVVVNDNRGQVQGVKASLFDVSDLSNPKLVDSIEIGQRGSHSAALDDHKAFMFIPERDLVVMPISEVTQRDEKGYGNTVWDGAYVLQVTEDGILVADKVKHGSVRNDYVRWWSSEQVLRSLYVGDYLYTLSSDKLVVSDFADETSIESVETVYVPQTEKDVERYYDEPMPVDMVAVDSVVLE